MEPYWEQYSARRAWDEPGLGARGGVREGVLLVWNAGIQEYRNPGMQEFRNAGIQECRKSGMQEFINSGLLVGCKGSFRAGLVVVGWLMVGGLIDWWAGGLHAVSHALDARQWPADFS